MPRRVRNSRRQEGGFAIIAVTLAILFLVAMTVEFDTNTNVDTIAAANVRDDVRTHFLARSGVNLSRLLIEVQTQLLDRYRKQLGNVQIADFAPLIIGGFGGSPEEVKAMSQMLGGTEGDAIKGLGVSAGQFDLQIGTEDGKINMNCGGGVNVRSQETLKAQLEALLYFKAFDPLFEKPDADGWQRDRATQVAAMIDYVDADHAQFGASGTPEQYGYETLRDSYKPKNNRLDSAGEIKLMRGVDDRFWTLFGGQLTVYGGCKVNLAAVNDPKLIASVIFLAAKNPDDPVLREPARLWALAKLIIEAKSLGFFWDDTKQFADFVKDPAAQLEALVGGNPQAASAVPGAQGLLQTLDQIEGVELDAGKLSQIADVGPRRTYRVEVTAQIGPERRRTIKKITAIWDTQVVPQNARTPGGKGAWVFWKEE